MKILEQIDNTSQMYVNELAGYIEKYINPKLLGTIIVSFIFLCNSIECLYDIVYGHYYIFNTIMFIVMVIGGYIFSADCYRIYKSDEKIQQGCNITSKENTWIFDIKKYLYIFLFIDIFNLVLTIFIHTRTKSVDINFLMDVVFILGILLVCSNPKPPVEKNSSKEVYTYV